MHAAVKVLIGLILIVLGLGMFADEIAPVIPYYQSQAISHFFLVLEGVVPIFFILVGLFVVWLEVDELKAQKELNREVEKKPETKPETKPEEKQPLEKVASKKEEEGKKEEKK